MNKKSLDEVTRFYKIVASWENAEDHFLQIVALLGKVSYNLQISHVTEKYSDKAKAHAVLYLYQMAAEAMKMAELMEKNND